MRHQHLPRCKLGAVKAGVGRRDARSVVPVDQHDGTASGFARVHRLEHAGELALDAADLGGIGGLPRGFRTGPVLVEPFRFGFHRAIGVQAERAVRQQQVRVAGFAAAQIGKFADKSVELPDRSEVVEFAAVERPPLLRAKHLVAAVLHRGRNLGRGAGELEQREPEDLGPVERAELRGEHRGQLGALPVSAIGQLLLRAEVEVDRHHRAGAVAAAVEVGEIGQFLGHGVAGIEPADRGPAFAVGKHARQRVRGPRLAAIGPRIDLEAASGKESGLLGPQCAVEAWAERHSVESEMRIEHHVHNGRTRGVSLARGLQVLRFVRVSGRAAGCGGQSGELEQQHRGESGEDDLEQGIQGKEARDRQAGPDRVEPVQIGRRVEVDRHRCEQRREEERKARPRRLLDQSEQRPEQGEAQQREADLGPEERVLVEIEQVEQTGPERDDPHRVIEPAIARCPGRVAPHEPPPWIGGALARLGLTPR